MITTNEGWNIIYNSMIKKLLDFLKTGVFHENSPKTFMDAYTAVHKLADDEWNSGQFLFDKFKEIIRDYVTPTKQTLMGWENENLIDSFLVEYTKYIQLSYWMCRIFHYLDRFFTKNKNWGTLYTNSLALFREIIFIPLKEKLFIAVNCLIKEDRDCNVIYRFKIKNILRIIEEIDLTDPELIKEGDRITWSGKHVDAFITEWFDKTFKDETVNYIKEKSKYYASTLNAQEYVNTYLKYLNEEEARKNDYINTKFREQIDSINTLWAVTTNAKWIGKMETGVRFMWKNKLDDELKKLFILFQRDPNSWVVITEEFDPYIRERGDELYKNKELMKDPIKFIPEWVKFKKEMDDLVSNTFGNNVLFQDTKNKAFSYFMNKEHYAKQLSNYTDHMMKKGIKSLNESQIELNLNDIINWFKCLNNKLTFQIEANKKLSDRLIQGKSISWIAEKNFISKLKTEAGVTYVTKMTDMMKDWEMSKNESETYRQQPHRGMPNGIQFSTQVVSQSAWEVPQSKMEKIEIPSCLVSCIDSFNDFYIGRHKNHKWLWCYGWGTWEIQYLYLNKKYISTSTLTQYALWCELEKREKLKMETISSILGYNVDALINDAMGMIFNPTFNKNRSPTAGLIVGNFKDELKPDTEVVINKKFMSNATKIWTLPMIMKKKADNQDQEVEEAKQIKKYQDIILQINITRIMKSRIGAKTTHQWLVGETAKQVELFKAQPQQIKEAIEKLLEKTILKRNEKDRTWYEYVA